MIQQWMPKSLESKQMTMHRRQNNVCLLIWVDDINSWQIEENIYIFWFVLWYPNFLKSNKCISIKNRLSYIYYQAAASKMGHESSYRIS